MNIYQILFTALIAVCCVCSYIIGYCIGRFNMIDNIQATKRIYSLMCEIRDTIRNLDPELEDPYLSLTIQSDSAISFNNTYWDLPVEQQINFHEDFDDADD